MLQVSEKSCAYCKAKGWRGIGHTVNECFTKKREMNNRDNHRRSRGSAKRARITGEDDGIYIDMIHVKLTSSTAIIGCYEYDTAASHHTSHDLHRMYDLHDVHLKVTAHDGATTFCKKQGTLILWHNGKEMHLHETLYDPSFSNLISGQRIKGKHILTIHDDHAELGIGQKVIYRMTRDRNGALWIQPDDSSYVQYVAGASNPVYDLHKRYGHIAYDALRALPECPPFTQKPYCQACEKGKATKPVSEAQENPRRTIRPLERIHADLVGPITPTSMGTQCKYLLVVSDDYSRYIMTRPLQKKSQTAEILLELIKTIENMAQPYRVHQLQADWGGEFRNHILDVVRKQGIIYKDTVPGHSETNAIAERANRTIMTMSRTALVVTCFDYGIKDKLSPRSYRARLTGYTATYTGCHWPHESSEKTKNPYLTVRQR